MSNRNGDEPDPLYTVRLSEVEPESVSWLWHGRLPAGKLVLLEGDPGQGKSTLALDLAARVSVGGPWPDGSGTAPAGCVVILSAEDGPGDTIRPRFDAAGGDPDQAHIILDPAALPDDVGRLGDVICGSAQGTRLVIVDPLAAYLAGAVDAHRDHSVRRALAPLATLAANTGACILVIRHLNKGSGPAIYRGGGSIGIAGAARVVLVVGADPENESRRILAASKSNLSAVPPSLAYSLEDVGGVGRVAWGGTSHLSAGQLLAVQDRGDESERSALDDAVAYLTGALNDGPRSARDIVAESRREGIAARTLDRARARLRVRSSPDGFRGPRMLSLPPVSANNGQSTPPRQHYKDGEHWAETGGDREPGDPDEMAREAMREGA